MYTPLHRVLHSLGMHLININPAELWPEPEPADFLPLDPPQMYDTVLAPYGSRDCQEATVVDTWEAEDGEVWFVLAFDFVHPDGTHDILPLSMPYSAFDPKPFGD